MRMLSMAALEHDVDGVDSGRSAGEGHDKRPLGLVVGDIRTRPCQCANTEVGIHVHGDVSHSFD